MSSPEAAVVRDAVEQLARSLNKTLEMLTPARTFPSKADQDPTPEGSTDDNPPMRGEAEETGLYTSNYARRPTAPRRETMMERILRPEMSKLDATIYREQPSYAHIKFHALTVSAAFKFFQDIDKYESQHRAKLPAATIVADRVRDEILIEAPMIGVSDFYSLENDELFMLVQKAIRPRNALEFAKKLSTTVLFPSLPHGYQPSLQHFKPLYDGILIFQRIFMECFNFLAYENVKNIPRCDHRVGGLIRIFVDLIPFEFGKHVLSSLKSHKYDNFGEFLKNFMECIHSIKLAYESTRSHAQFFDTQSKDAMTRGPPAYATRDYSSSSKRHSIAFLTSDEYVGNEQEAPNQDDVPQREFLYGDPVHDLNSLNAPSTTFDGGCYRKFAGACTKKTCPFKHDPVSMHELYLKQRKRLEDSPYKAPPVGYTPSAVVKTSRPPQRTNHLAHVVDDYVAYAPHEETEEVLLNSSDDEAVRDTLNAFVHAEEKLHVANMVFSRYGIHNYINVVYHQADVNIGDGSIVPIKCLMDSGATTASYVDARWLEPYRDFLVGNGALRAYSAKTTLADNCTDLRINEICTLAVCMRWSDKVWDANVDFLVLPSMTTQIIIGLPHILLHFRQLFVAKILEYPSDEPNNSLLSIFEGAVQPWHDDPIAADAEEDIDHPCLFSDALHFMETGHEKALLEFRAQFDSHVSPEMKEQTNIYELLETKGAKVFVPQNWEGINRIEPIEFQWKADMPERMIPKVRPINPNSFQNSRTEVARLQGYFLVPSQSPIASPLVIAPKSTPPYIRVCGDYVAVNKYIVTGASVIPHVQKELEKIRGFSVFTDLDLTNSFHQLPLGPLTAEKLSLVTPWGQFRPKFLPEGVTPASGLLQKHVQEIFQDFADWTIVIFDNLLVLAHSHQDAYEKLDIILDRCIERNLFLKFAKSWIGVKEVKFFGYLCRHQSYGMTAERKDSILSAPMPTNTKQMQSFLGAALFFKSFVPDFSIYTAELHDMTKQNFDWNPSSWTVDYAAIFQRCKRALVNAAELVYPDYTLEWTLRVDASDKGVGAVLFQTYVDAGGNTMHQPISFTSKKFSDTAQRWHTFEKEAFGIYFGVHSNDYFLRGKPFLLETDHRNLLWIEKSQNPKVIRWLMYLQAFIFKVRHIAGIANSVADWASRIHFLCGTTQPLDLSRRDILHICHDDRSGHLGIKRTWHLIQQRYPEAGISMQMVADFVTECSVCQKVRTDLNTPIQPVVRHLAQPHHRSAIGIDVLSLPQDDNGNVALYVIRNVFTKLVFLEPTKTHSAESLASCLFGFYATFGLYDTIRSDPGSDLMADVVHILNSWFGIHHTVSLVGRHTSSGVEAANRQILRYLRCIFTDSSIVKRWSDSSIINWVQLLMNIYDDSETSISPFVATFGSSDKEYATVPSELTMTSANKFIATLDDDLAVVRSLVRKHQTQLVSKRLATNPTSPARYQPGDLVLLRNRVEFPPKSKLHPLSLGPYRVLQHDKNDVLVESLVDKRQRTLFVGDLLPFFGSHDEAVRMARRDDDQEVVVAILAHRGEPRQRRSMDFKVHFGDSSVLWLPWSSDIAQTIAYEMYINARPMLRPLRFTVQALLREDKILNASPITEVAVGTFAYVDLRWYGYGWFEALDLPDHDNAQYVVKFRYEAFNKERTVADIFCHIFKERWKVNHVFVVEYGMSTNFDATSMVLVDAAFVKKFPSVAKNVASRPPPRPSSGKTI